MTAPSGQTADIPVTITDDGHNEPEETVVLTLLPGSGYIVDRTADEHTPTIPPNDAPVVSFTEAEVSYGVAGSAARDQDYRILRPVTLPVGAGETRIRVPVEIFDDGRIEGR